MIASGLGTNKSMVELKAKQAGTVYSMHSVVYVSALGCGFKRKSVEELRRKLCRDNCQWFHGQIRSRGWNEIKVRLTIASGSGTLRLRVQLKA